MHDPETHVPTQQAAAGTAMGGQAIRLVAVTDKLRRELFVRFPWTVYQNDPLWVPPLLSEAREFIDPRRHPFYRHGSAVQYLAMRGDAVVGRIGASDDPRYNEFSANNLGCFGLFESLDDAPVAHALLDAAAGWLRQRGRDRMRGPIDYSTSYLTGLLIDGFSVPARVTLNYQPAYYRPLIESYGLTKARDAYTWWLDHPPPIGDWQRLVDRLAARDITIRPMRKRDLAAEIARCKQIYNEAWADNWGFVPLTDAELAHYGRKLAGFIDEKLCLVAEYRGEPVAFSLTLPDIYEALRPLDGRLTRWGLPIGLVRLYREMRRIRTCFFFAIGVRRRYRHRGVAEALLLRTLERAVERGYSGVEMGWTLEDNAAVERTITNVGAARLRTYRIYDTPL